MEKLILTPKELEIVVGNGSTEGAVDLFSYGAEEAAARSLGSLFIVGWRQADTNTMGYMVSLIAALARREYYANPADDPKESFSRTLRKINEVVDEFFKSEGAQLAVGVFAIAAGQIMVSKLDKFKILLARDGQVIDILNNVALFSKEHVQKRQFSSIISGSIQAGDRLLAYYPAKNIVARERSFKPWLLTDSGPALAARLAEMGTGHQDFAASFVHVDMVQAPLPVDVTPPPLPTPTPEEEPETGPVPAPSVPVAPAPQLAWSPRQAAMQRVPVTPAAEPEQEVPNLIPTEFSLGKRRSAWRDRLGFLRMVRLDGRGKAAMLAVIAAVIVTSALVAKSIWFTSAEEQRLNEVISSVQQDIESARTASDPVVARALLAQVITTLQQTTGAQDSRVARDLADEATRLMDNLDDAHTATLSVVAQLDPESDRIILATYSSQSDSLWALTTDREDALSVVRIENGSISQRAAISDVRPDLLVGWQDGVIALDFETRTILRIESSEPSAYSIPTQETILDAAVFGDSVYLLTDVGILRVSDLATTRPVTRPWLADGTSLVTGAKRLVIDGSIHVFGNGTLTTYYRGELEQSVNTPLDPSGAWRLTLADDGMLAAAVPDRLRIYQFSIEDGALTGTLKVESQQPLVTISSGPDGTYLVVTQDNRIWQVQ